MKKKYIVGITGGAGSGKSTIVNYIKSAYKADFIIADEIGRALMEKDKILYNVLKEAYGTDILSEDESIDRKKLAKIAFSTKEEQDKINSLEHPYITAEIEKRIECSEYEYIFIEAALLKEGGLLSICDSVIFVKANLKLRMKRLKESRLYSAKKCGLLFKRQLKDEEFEAFSDYVIENNDDFEMTKKETDQVLLKIGLIKGR